MYKHLQRSLVYLLSLLSTIYIISPYPSLPSCSFTSTFPTVGMYPRWYKKRCYSQGNKFAPDVQDFKNILSPKHGVSFRTRGGSRIFFRRGCTRLLLYFNTNKPHSLSVFGRIPVVVENRRSSRWGGGGCAPHAPTPRSAPENEP